jgi:hypothetical protein
MVPASLLGVLGFSFWICGLASNSADTAELAPAQIVAMRFPSEWSGPAPRLTQQATVARPTQTSQPAPTRNAESNRGDGNKPGNNPGLKNAQSPQPSFALASAASAPFSLPKQALGYADPAGEAIEPHATHEPSAAARAPEKRAAPRPAPKPANLLNDMQLASIKERLKLTPDQERYWPAVESALRVIGQRQVKDGGRKGDLKNLDPNSEEVQQLKSAAVPLLMTMRESQKEEVRVLARLIGLDRLAAQF